jgi:osmotically-inducible protein OsmY
MKKNVLMLVGVLALFTGFVVAQNPGAQDRPDQSQQPQTQEQTPDTQQTPQSQSPTSAAGQSVQAQIQQQPELSGVMVNESSNKVELSGTVASKSDKEKAKTIAESNANGRKVINKIKVSSNENSSPSSTPYPPK